MKPLNHTAAIVLAGGKGTRMKSVSKNKVTVTLADKPMISHTIDKLIQAQVNQLIVVVGFQADSVKQALGNKVEYAFQAEQLGTGHALKMGLPILKPDVNTILTMSGDDSAFYPASLYKTMVTHQQTTQADVLVLTIKRSNPTGLGRIVRSKQGNLIKIVEEKNATDTERQIKEINTGFYCFKRDFLINYIDEIKPNSVTKEYYATDLVEIALKHNLHVEAYLYDDDSIWQGVNTLDDYKKAKLKYQQIKHE